ncbi:MAG TPA: toll/interleukin-1 receptor domain-containing protein [Verrucomicrobiales bacterium]|nr:toll/interleukin-1 receptor domain-containing protein [Verrucomicrobiales bacterium]
MNLGHLGKETARPIWFLSYNSRFLEQARRLCDRIEADAPVRVWLDDREILPGDPFLDRMEQGLRASDTILVLIGKEQGRYQRKEVEMMIVNEATGNRSKRIVPLLLPEATQEDVPYWLRARSQVRLDLDAAGGWAWLKKLAQLAVTLSGDEGGVVRSSEDSRVGSGLEAPVEVPLDPPPRPASRSAVELDLCLRAAAAKVVELRDSKKAHEAIHGLFRVMGNVEVLSVRLEAKLQEADEEGAFHLVEEGLRPIIRVVEEVDEAVTQVRSADYEINPALNSEMSRTGDALRACLRALRDATCDRDLGRLQDQLTQLESLFRTQLPRLNQFIVEFAQQLPVRELAQALDDLSASLASRPGEERVAERVGELVEALRRMEDETLLKIREHEYFQELDGQRRMPERRFWRNPRMQERFSLARDTLAEEESREAWDRCFQAVTAAAESGTDQGFVESRAEFDTLFMRVFYAKDRQLRDVLDRLHSLAVRSLEIMLFVGTGRR